MYFENHILKYFLLKGSDFAAEVQPVPLLTTLVTQDLSSERTTLGN